MRAYFILLRVVVAFLLFTNSGDVYSQIKKITSANVNSEGNFYTKNGKIYSDAVVLKFNRNVIPLAKGVQFADKNNIHSSFTDIKQTIKDLENTFGNIKIEKVIPDAVWGDTNRKKKLTGETVQIHDFSQLFILRFSEPFPLDSVINIFNELPEAEYVHQPIIYEYHTSPNDQYYQLGYQWNLNAVNAEAAWNITHGDNTIKIGIVDEGIMENHTDLQGKIVGGTGYFDPDEKHGTWVAGVLGAKTNNTQGIASLGWDLKLYNYGGPTTVESNSLIAQRIVSATNADMDIINMSFGTLRYAYEEDLPVGCTGATRTKWLQEIEIQNVVLPSDYPEIREAVSDAIALGIICIASAGNTSKNDELDLPESEFCDPMYIPFPNYPAQYSGVIAISGTQLLSGNEVFRYTWNYGSFIDVSAPGYNIYTTDPNGSYSYQHGTSFSTPLTSALAGLILSLNPLSNTQVESILKNSADKIAAPANHPYVDGWSEALGYGRINAYNALLLTHAYNNKSISQTATANNGQRKVVKDVSGNFHTVFSSGGEIFYRRQNVSGSWQDPVKISYVNGSNDAPSIEVGQTNHIAITWQRQTATNTYSIYFARSTDQGSTWPQKYALTSSVSSSLIPKPVLAIDKTLGFYTVVYNTSTALKNKTATNPSGIGNWNSETSLPGSTIGDSNPSLSTGSTSIILCTYQNGSQIYYRYQNTSGVWSSAESLMSNIPGSSHQTPTITGIPSSSQVNVAWQGITSIGKSVIYHRKKDTYNGSWPSEYYTTYYEGQQLPSLSGLATNKVDLVFQTIPSIGNQVHKMRFNGTTWSSPTLIAYNAVYPSVSIGSTTAKYIYTSGITSPYTVTLNDDILSKESEPSLENYSRSIAIMNNPEEYLEVVLNKMYFKMKDGSTQRVDFLPADLEELKAKENFDLTTSNAWDLMKGIKDLTIPVGADELVFDYTVKGEKIDKVIEGNTAYVDLSFGLNILTKNEKAEKVKSVNINSGKITETKLQEIIPLSSLTAERGFDKIDLGLKVKGIVPKSTAFASLGHIFDYAKVTVSNGTQANKIDNADGTITEELTTQNYPNPFNPTTLIQFTIKNSGKVTLKVYDVLGREVANLLNSYHESGSYEIPFDGSNLPSGIYFYNLTANGKSLTKKMMLLK